VETFGNKQVYANPWMTVREGSMRRSDGSTGIYGVVDGPDIALTVPANGDRLHLVEQYRYPVGGRRWEFPPGASTVDLTRNRERLPSASCAKRPGSWRRTPCTSRTGRSRTPEGPVANPRSGFRAGGAREYGVPHTPIHVRPWGKPVEVRR
jgi:hypothetical protein